MADVELLPLTEPARWCITGAEQQAALCEWAIDYARANVLHHTAAQAAEIEALRAEVAETREFRDKMANAIGNDQLRRFIEKHGEPVPLTIRMQAAEARAERLAEALREARPFVAYAYDQGIVGAEDAGRELDAAIAQEDRNG